MTKLEPFNVNATIDDISNYAPIIIFVVMVLMFGLTGWMQYNFFEAANTSVVGSKYLNLLFPILLQILRFVAGFLSASFFKKGRWAFGIFVFFFSLWLSIYEYNEVSLMADFWSTVDVNLKPLVHSETKVSITKEVINGVMTVLIWGALVLEFFLAVWLGGKTNSLVTSFSTNGAIKENGQILPQLQKKD